MGSLMGRVAAVLTPLGSIWRTVPADRGRTILDCGRGSSAFGLRLAAMFPDRFAGVVLRWPALDDSVRVRALEGVPVLLVRSDDTAEACRQRLDKYHSETAPIIPFYEDKGLLKRIDGVGSPAEVTERIATALA